MTNREVQTKSAESGNRGTREMGTECSFTVVFDGDIRNLKFNPLTAETVFGQPVALKVGDAIQQVDDLRDDLLKALEEISEMFMSRPDMLRAIQPLIGPAEKATFDRAAAAIAKAQGAP